MLISKSTLSLVYNSHFDINFNGLYSVRHDLFFSLKNATTWTIYSNLASNSIVNENVEVNEAYPVKLSFSGGQSKLITLLQGANYLKIR